jgi:hypothetical protein
MAEGFIGARVGVAGGGWSRPPASPVLSAGSLHVWAADLDSAPDPAAGALGRDELARAARFPRAADGVLWSRGRGILSGLLDRYATADGDDGATPPRFSISRSGPRALFAFARVAVGVDIELGARLGDPARLAGRLLGPAAGPLLADLGPEERRSAVLGEWTAFEASRKCAGVGIWAPEPLVRPWVTGLPDCEPGAGAAALAGGPPLELRLWAWDAEVADAQ